jgi:hypothetical protein
MRARYPHEYSAALARDLGRSLYSVFNRAKALGLMKSEVFHQSDRSGRIQKGRTDPRMIATQLKPGNQPWNKGAKGSTGIHPNCRATQFKKGEVQGRAAALVQPIGAERISKDGILQRKVNNEMPFQRRWRSVHSLVWEAAHGPIPQGHKVVFLPGQFTNVAAQITPEKLELVSCAELMRRNSYHTRYPKELGLVIQMRGQLNRKINRRIKRQGDAHEKQD